MRKMDKGDDIRDWGRIKVFILSRAVVVKYRVRQAGMGEDHLKCRFEPRMPVMRKHELSHCAQQMRVTAQPRHVTAVE